MDENKASYEQLEAENERLKEQLDAIETSKKSQRKAVKWTLRKSTGIFVGKGLKSAIKETLTEFNTEKKVSVDTASNLGAHLIWRLTRIGIFAIVIAILPTLFLIIQTMYLGKQNEKIDKQNELITNQNARLEQQTYLQEAGRRSSLVFLMNNVLDKMDEELKDTLNKDRNLSDQLIGRIIALSKSLKPYKYLENDSLSIIVSPERGQLLINLVNAKLGNDTYWKIFFDADFSFAELEDYSFYNIDFGDINLSNSILNNILFKECIFDSSNFMSTVISNVKISNCSFEELDLTESLIKRLVFISSQVENMKIDLAYIHQLDLVWSFIFNLSLNESLVQKVYTGGGYIDYLYFIENNGNLKDFFKLYFPEKYKMITELETNVNNLDDQNLAFITPEFSRSPVIYESQLSKDAMKRMQGVFSNNFKSVRILSDNENYDKFFPAKEFSKKNDSIGIVYSNTDLSTSRDRFLKKYALDYKNDTTDLDIRFEINRKLFKVYETKYERILKLLSEAPNSKIEIDYIIKTKMDYVFNGFKTYEGKIRYKDFIKQQQQNLKN